jgi:hypothetical protein
VCTIHGGNEICKDEQEGFSELGHRCMQHQTTVGEVDDIMDEEACQSQQDMRFNIAFGPIKVSKVIDDAKGFP